jgi:hypothetical protein
VPGNWLSDLPDATFEVVINNTENATPLLNQGGANATILRLLVGANSSSVTGAVGRLDIGANAELLTTGAPVSAIGGEVAGTVNVQGRWTAGAIINAENDLRGLDLGVGGGTATGTLNINSGGDVRLGALRVARGTVSVATGGTLATYGSTNIGGGPLPAITPGAPGGGGIITDPDFVAVDNIVIANGATTLLDFDLTDAVTVSSATVDVDPTNTTIVWSIVNPGTARLTLTGANFDQLTLTAPVATDQVGLLRATIENGLTETDPFVEHFLVTVGTEDIGNWNLTFGLRVLILMILMMLLLPGLP